MEATNFVYTTLDTEGSSGREDVESQISIAEQI